MNTSNTEYVLSGRRLDQLKALASDVRFQILEWLKSPGVFFSDQVSGNPDEIGVCVTLLAKKASVTQPTISRHLEILQRCGFLDVRKIQSWSFYSRNETELDNFYRWLSVIKSDGKSDCSSVFISKQDTLDEVGTQM